MQEGATAGNLQRANSRNKLWEVWCRFCAAHNSPEMLDAVEDPVPILVAFARRYRDGRLAIRGQPIRARSVEDVVRQIAKAFTDVGALDPRLNPHGRMDARLSGLWRHYRHQDPEPSRTKPIPTSVLQQASNTCKISRDPGFLCLGDMMWVAFYFLCRPGEYTADGDDSHPFRFKDVQLWLGPRRLDLKHAPPADILNAMCSALTFTTQKNCVRGEVVAQGLSGDLDACATRAIGRRILHLRRHRAPSRTPLCAFYQDGQWHTITSVMMTKLLREAAKIVGPSIGFNPDDISARSLRASGAMAMLCGGIDNTTTRLRGRWRSDTMLRYLTVQASPLVADVAPRMLRGGQYTLVPNTNVVDVDAMAAQATAAAPPALSEAPAESPAAAAAAIAAANPPAPAA